MTKPKPPKTALSRFTGWLRLDFEGVVGGLVFFCLSCTPSLLPRGYVLQGVVSGISFAIGYGLGVAVSFLLHKLPKRSHGMTPRAKRITVIVLSIIAIVFMFAGFGWQQELRELTEATAAPGDYPLRIVLVTAVIAGLLIWAGRGIRRLARYFTNKLHGLPRTIALWGGAILAGLLIIFLLNGILFRVMFNVINYSFGLANRGTPKGIYQPQDGLYSGSPGSLIDWNSLGEKGREFVATAPSKTDIASFNGNPAQQPSRLYVGLESAPTLQERVDLLVKELDRTNAATHEAVLIAIPTGSGGINPRSVQSVEYLLGGDITTLGIQYSYLPSWLSFIADQEVARQTGKAITDAVYQWWDQLPADDRPKLLLYGESLGTLGADGAFSTPDEMQSRMSGVLLVGPPNANKLWSGIVANRDHGSRQVLPTFQQGQAVRFSDGSGPYNEPADQPWQTNRIGILQNASDPVVWGALQLFVQKPDWLREPRGSDVLSNMQWYPFVTGAQVAADLPFAFGATPGHGHRYDTDLAASWAAILDVEQTAEQAAKLQQIIASIPE